jgi:hypothetical protein
VSGSAMHTSDSNVHSSGMESPAKRRGRLPQRGEVAAEMASISASGDPSRAAILLQQLEQDGPDASEAALSITKCRAIISRALWMDEAWEAMRRNFEEDRFSDAFGQLRQALNLSRGAPYLAAVASQQAERQAALLLPANWRIAAAVLQETAEVFPNFIPDPPLRAKLEQARLDETLTLAIYKADRIQLQGHKEDARLALHELLVANPQDSRILDRIKALDQTLAAPAPLVVKVPAAELVAQPAASEQVDGDGDYVLPLPRSWPAKVVIPSRSWQAAKNFGSLAGTTAMLAAATVLLWQHFEKPSRVPAAAPHPLAAAPMFHPSVEKPAAVPKPVVEQVAPEEEQAWDLVKSSQNAAVIRNFLLAYPTSLHVLRAKIKLASLAWETADKTSVPALDQYLRSFPLSPYRQEAQRLRLLALSKGTMAAPAPAAEDREAILRMVRSFQEHAQTGSLVVADVPAAKHAGDYDDPIIIGDEATVSFHPAGGGTVENFTLVRQDGNWKVQSVR